MSETRITQQKFTESLLSYSTTSPPPRTKPPKPKLWASPLGQLNKSQLFKLYVCNGGVLGTRGLSILQLVALEGRWDTVVQCVW